MNSDKDPSGDQSRSATQPGKGAASPLKDASRFEQYATTQAAANGIEGDVRKEDKTEEESLGAQMTDRR